MYLKVKGLRRKIKIPGGGGGVLGWGGNESKMYWGVGGNEAKMEEGTHVY